MTTVYEAYMAVLEFVRGSTGLKCEIEDHFLNFSTANTVDTQFKVICKKERINFAPCPTSLIMESMRVSIHGMVILSRNPDDLAGRQNLPIDDFNSILLKPIGELNLITCHFEWETPTGGMNGHSRSFHLRNHYLYQIV